MKLDRDFFAQPTVRVARQLLGARLIFHGPHGRREGMIVETEAYVGPEDQASHASRGRTLRTEPMFGSPGYTYVYLIYGMHHCLNIVTEAEGYPAAVLIRSLKPLRATSEVNDNHPGSDVTLNGPGKVCRWLGLTRAHNQIDAAGDMFYIEKGTKPPPPAAIRTGPRIGVDYAGIWATKPWRFYLANSKQRTANRKQKKSFSF